MSATQAGPAAAGEDFQPTQVYQLFIKATPERIWEAITTPDFTRRYFHRARITVTPEGGHCLLTVIHDELQNSPKTARSVAGAGWMGVLSGLKTLLETGESLFGYE